MSNTKQSIVADKPIFLLARTAPASALLHSTVIENGMQLLHCALVQAQPEPMSDALSALLDDARNADWHIFVSPHAVQMTRLLWPKMAIGSGRLAAVGAGTATALAAPNVLVPIVGEGAQALLDSAELQHVDGDVVAIYAAPDGLMLLEYTLTQRGARVLVLPVYRRVPCELTQMQIEQCRKAEFAYVGSVAFLEALLAARAGQPLRVLTPSERVATAARVLGCIAIVCEGSSDQAIAAQIQLL